MQSLPSHRYAAAEWRGLTSRCPSCGRALLSFDLVDAPCGSRLDLIAQLQAGEPVRLMIDAVAMRHLLDVLPEVDHASVSGHCPTCRVQPDSSSGSPTVEGSMQGGGQNV